MQSFCPGYSANHARFASRWQSFHWASIIPVKLMLDCSDSSQCSCRHRTCHQIYVWPRLSNQCANKQSFGPSVHTFSQPWGGLWLVPSRRWLAETPLPGTTVLEMQTTLAGGETSSTPGCRSLAADHTMSQLTAGDRVECPLRRKS